LDAWWDTYFRDLWNRTNEEQRACLATLLASGKAELARIVKQSALDEGQVKRNLQKLRQRDLVLPYENDVYDIASPIFRAWVEHSIYN
jgi:DNA-binding MarR family transcriptional regulator